MVVREKIMDSEEKTITILITITIINIGKEENRDK